MIRQMAPSWARCDRLGGTGQLGTGQRGTGEGDRSVRIRPRPSVRAA
jgi:hypothetical protein